MSGENNPILCTSSHWKNQNLPDLAMLSLPSNLLLLAFSSFRFGSDPKAKDSLSD
jgi:hypothetical protein